jgi:hypothetical protein
MNRLRRVVESEALGEKTGRVAYVLRPETLPAAHAGFEWREDSSFNAAEAVLADGRLKDIFTAAIKDGHAIVKRAVRR